jgi:uncharacterized protein (DUF3820 family)
VLLIDGQLIMNFGKWKGKPIVDVDVGMWRWITERDFPDHVLLLAIKMVDRVQDIHSWAEKHAVEKCW